MAGVLRIAARSVDDAVSGASRTISTGVRKGTSPLSVAALGGAGAYAYGHHTDAEEEASRTERYNALQRRLSDIDKMYNEGEISRARKDELQAQARQDYYASAGGEDNTRGLTLTQVVGQMGTVQLTAVAAVALGTVYFVLRPIAMRIAHESPSMEELLG